MVMIIVAQQRVDFLRFFLIDMFPHSVGAYAVRGIRSPFTLIAQVICIV
jgi:hypothetical protein